jgi:hypothetical protein
MTRQEAAEFAKMARECEKDTTLNSGTKAIEAVMRWLADPRNVGKRFGWTLTKTEAPKID